MLRATVRRTLRRRRLLPAHGRLLVACSGGPDSVALTHALAGLRGELGLTLEVAAVDHGLRPEAAGELDLVARLARGLGLPFHPLRITVSTERPSLQAAARRARYRALLALAAERGGARVAVGHTMDDQAETVLARVLRGAGLDGLSGIAPRRADGVVRPLLDCRRRDVEAHVARHGLEVVRDPSNRDPRFLRTRVRATLLPALAGEDPRVVEHLAALADEAREVRAAARRRARALLEAHGPGDALETAPLLAEPPAVRRQLLRRWVRARAGRSLGRAHLEAIDALLRGPGPTGGPVLLGGGWALEPRPDGGAPSLVLAHRPGRPSRGGSGGSACPDPPGSPED